MRPSVSVYFWGPLRQPPTALFFDKNRFNGTGISRFLAGLPIFFGTTSIFATATSPRISKTSGQISTDLNACLVADAHVLIDPHFHSPRSVKASLLLPVHPFQIITRQYLASSIVQLIIQTSISFITLHDLCQLASGYLLFDQRAFPEGWKMVLIRRPVIPVDDSNRDLVSPLLSDTHGCLQSVDRRRKGVLYNDLCTLKGVDPVEGVTGLKHVNKRKAPMVNRLNKHFTKVFLVSGKASGYEARFHCHRNSYRIEGRHGNPSGWAFVTNPWSEVGLACPFVSRKPGYCVPRA